MKTESLLWYIQAMEQCKDTDERMKLLTLAYKEGVADGGKQSADSVLNSISLSI